MIAVAVTAFEADFAAEAVAGFVTAVIVVSTLAPVWVLMPAVAELVLAVGAAEAESVEFEPVGEVLVAVAEATAAWVEGIVREPDGTEDSENRIAG